MNRFVEPAEAAPLEIHRWTRRSNRGSRRVAGDAPAAGRRPSGRALERLDAEARDPSVNLMPVTIDLARARASLGEIVARLRQVWGSYAETPVF